MDDAQRGVAVTLRPRDDADRKEVVYLFQGDLLPPDLLPDAEDALDPPLQGDDRHTGLPQLLFKRALEIVDGPLGRAAACFHALQKRLVARRIEMAERKLLELVLHLVHPEAVRDGRVDVDGLLRDLQSALFAKMTESAHVVKAIRQLDEDDAHVVHHRQQHLPEVLRLPLLARRKWNRAYLRDPFDDVGDLGTEESAHVLDGGQRVFDDVVQQARRDRHVVEMHLGDEVRNLQRMRDVLLSGPPDLARVLQGRELVGPMQQIRIRVRVVRADRAEQIVEAEHGKPPSEHDDTGSTRGGQERPSPLLTCYSFCFTIAIRLGGTGRRRLPSRESVSRAPTRLRFARRVAGRSGRGREFRT